MDIGRADDKVVVITGGAGVLGSAISEGLCKAGALVCILGRNLEKAQRRAKEITYEGGDCFAYKADVLDKDALVKVRDEILGKYKKIDILINCAGGNLEGATISPTETFSDLSIDDFKKVNDLNLLGSVLPTQVFVEPMVEKKKGCIINISSMAADRAITRVMGYSAAKAGIDNFTKWLSVELNQKHGPYLRVNSIAPGFYLADQNRSLLTTPDGSLTERGKQIISMTPMGRFGKPEELISTVLWLVSDASSFVTGVVVPVDGGFSAFSGV